MTPRPCSATDWEIAQIRHLIGGHGGSVYVEIGSYRGGSLLAYGGAMPRGSSLVAIDKPMSDEASQGLLDTAQRMRDRYAVEVILDDSQSRETLDRLDRVRDGHRIDVLLIDGDHSPAACRVDLNAYVPRVSPGGIVVMHDAGAAGPARAVDERVATMMAGVHREWQRASAGCRRMLIQEWPGYGVFWV